MHQHHGFDAFRRLVQSCPLAHVLTLLGSFRCITKSYLHPGEDDPEGAVETHDRVRARFWSYVTPKVWLAYKHSLLTTLG